MKGQLKKTEKGWVVSYPVSIEKYNGRIGRKELPLHPEDAIKLEIGFTDKFTKEIEFEMVEQVLEPNRSFESITVAKLIQPKQEESNWESVYNNYIKNYEYLSANEMQVFDWLKANYQSPKKL